MSSSAANITNQCIKKLIYELYPSIQHQFVLITSVNELSNADCSTNAKAFDLLNDLKNEFQSLTTYENKLVFPSVLIKSERKKQTRDTQQINIAELQQLTMGKEQRLLQIADELFFEIEKYKPCKKYNSIIKLTRMFKNDFAEQKNKWNKMISKL